MIDIKKHKLVLPTVLILLFVFEYLVSQTLKSFGDEYISLASNYGFFTQLNFDAGFDNGGSYGLRFKWSNICWRSSRLDFDKKFIDSKIFNFLWVFLIQIV